MYTPRYGRKSLLMDLNINHISDEVKARHITTVTNKTLLGYQLNAIQRRQEAALTARDFAAIKRGCEWMT
jgi:hypothetical protein